MTRGLMASPAILIASLLLVGDHGADQEARLIAPPLGPPDSAAYAWRPVAIGGGGFITGLSTDATGSTRIARTDVYGAYIWRETLNRWVQLVNATAMPPEDRAPRVVSEGVYEAVVAPSDPKRIYMATAGRLYRSDDQGGHFVRTAMPVTIFDPNSPHRHHGPFIAVAPTDPDLVLFGTVTQGLWRSDNGGVDWVRVESLPILQSSASDKSGRRNPGITVRFGPRSNEVWAFSPGRGAFRSVDAGRSFQPLSMPNEAAPLMSRRGAFGPDGAFYAVEKAEKKVWKFFEGHWIDLTGAPGLSPAAFGSVAVNPRTGAIFVFDEGGRVVVSSDGGSTWRDLRFSARVGTGDPPWLRVADSRFFATGEVAFDPVVPDRLWNAAGTGVYFADGVTGERKIVWISQTRGIEEIVANDVVAPPGQLPLFAGWDFGIHRRDNLTRFSTGYGPRERVLIAAQQLDWSAAHPEFIVTNASDTRKCCSEDGDAVMAGYSTDAGRSWNKFASLPQPPGTSAGDPWRMSFGTIAVSAADVNNIVWAPSFNRSPFFTKDRGRTWKRVVLPGERLPFTGSHADYYFHRKTLAADRVSAGVFYLAHSGDDPNSALAGLWVTHDGGASWRHAYKGEIAPNSRGSAKLRAVPGKAGHLFFTSAWSHGPDQALRQSTDGGANWTRLTRVDAVHDIAFGKPAPGADYPTLYIAGRVDGTYGIWRSTDRGREWSRIGEFPVGTLDEVVAMEADKDNFGRVYLGFKGSGWKFGQPSTCEPAPSSAESDLECYRVAPRPHSDLGRLP